MGRVRCPVREVPDGPPRPGGGHREITDPYARQRCAEDRRFLSEFPRRGTRRGAGPDAARRAARRDRRARDEDRHGALLCPRVQDEPHESRRRVRRRGCRRADPRDPVSVPGRSRHARPRLLPERRAAPSSIPGPVPRVPDHGAEDGRPGLTRSRGPGHLHAGAPHRAGALDQCREPRRGEDLQQGRRGRSAQAVPGLRLGGIHDGAGCVGGAGRGRQPAELFQGVRGDGQRVARGPLEALSEGVPHQRLRSVSEQGLRGRRVRVLWQDAPRGEGTPAPMEAGREHDQRQHGRDARQALCREALQAGSQGADGAARREPAAGVQGKHRHSSSG